MTTTAYRFPRQACTPTQSWTVEPTLVVTPSTFDGRAYTDAHGAARGRCDATFEVPWNDAWQDATRAWAKRAREGAVLAMPLIDGPDDPGLEVRAGGVALGGASLLLRSIASGVPPGFPLTVRAGDRMRAGRDVYDVAADATSGPSAGREVVTVSIAPAAIRAYAEGVRVRFDPPRLWRLIEGGRIERDGRTGAIRLQMKLVEVLASEAGAVTYASV